VTSRVQSRRLIRMFLIGTLTLSLLAFWAPQSARADYIPEVSATIGDPTPNPVPSGSTAATTAEFSLSATTAEPITVQIALQAPPGFGTLRLDSAGAELTNCLGDGSTAITCDWDGDSSNSPQSLSIFIDIDPSVAPDTGATLAAIVESASASPEVYASAFMYTTPPIGTTSLSGTVITAGGLPVDQACVFVLSSPTFVFPAITDASGGWSVTGLPDTYSFAVGVVPPFVGTFGPCAEAGPPPVPAAGDLQPVFVGDVWIDLSDPLLTGGLGDPYQFAVNAGATSFSSSASGLQACLTTAPGNQVPRPACVSAVTSTTATTQPGPATTLDVAGGSEVTGETLPFTGDTSMNTAALGVLLALAGIGLVLTGRYAAVSHEAGDHPTQP
jgi:hypothetical protein